MKDLEITHSVLASHHLPAQVVVKPEVHLVQMTSGRNRTGFGCVACESVRAVGGVPGANAGLPAWCIVPRLARLPSCRLLACEVLTRLSWLLPAEHPEHLWKRPQAGDAASVL